MPTALYVLIEDVVAVDGGGGQVYRRAIRDRYLSSPYFRQMLFEMNCFWGGGSVVFAAVITALVFTTPRDVAYTADLRKEKAAWGKYSLHGIPYTDDITCPTPQTRFISVSGRLMSSLPFQKPVKPDRIDDNNVASGYDSETV
ncbi:uncharacterized protein ARB_03234 [Trichophyton benhamiae CBS 112371]|uniref:Uncharacterized protein n=1 Tax=Arthroderma benhamiae (strain ATCC MYA-4681 / CBS 112371) TaxID=663331 RepID=D4B445_ARTBC|nr:uncharacterized protein ARB_03234 [Trichophyton benhamiae CBS 112371]EFE29893.1 hypothetical protein ARB_03234 [Trichophyton benhamiae CBS 112371]